MTDLQFDESTHTYKLNGRVIDSVTTILKPLSEHIYRGVPRPQMEAAAQLGTAVHKMIELDCLGTLDVDGLHERVAPYFPTWQRFIAETGFKVLKTEQRVYSKDYDFAGTLDLYGEMHGKTVLIDIKCTAAVPATAGPQTAAYKLALEEAGLWWVEERYVLQLPNPNDYRLAPLKDRGDIKTFLSCLTIHNWKKNQ
ncbi:hypothetical protein V3390_09370 [Luteimonas sp. FXH3W]|uniref:PD-(D/E)XK nuclease superfamily protein n=1 Tax=Aquilutibacter rugosus TaxID=3115820 RepID=A0ABU7V0X7_9GAMM